MTYLKFDGSVASLSPTPTQTFALSGGASATGSLYGTSGSDSLSGGAGVSMYGEGGGD